jgi:hypothetical protein
LGNYYISMIRGYRDTQWIKWRNYSSSIFCFIENEKYNIWIIFCAGFTENEKYNIWVIFCAGFIENEKSNIWVIFWGGLLRTRNTIFCQYMSNILSGVLGLRTRNTIYSWVILWAGFIENEKYNIWVIFILCGVYWEREIQYMSNILCGVYWKREIQYIHE